MGSFPPHPPARGSNRARFYTHRNRGRHRCGRPLSIVKTMRYGVRDIGSLAPWTSVPSSGMTVRRESWSGGWSTTFSFGLGGSLGGGLGGSSGGAMVSVQVQVLDTAERERCGDGSRCTDRGCNRE